MTPPSLGLIMKKYLISIILFFISSSANAVDGYKDLKFGSRIDEIQASNICSFEPLTDYGTSVKALECSDFKFGEQNVDAAALFINNKFLRFVIDVDVEYSEAIARQLTAKYGAPSSQSPQSDFDGVDRHPNRTAFVAFDSNTVYLEVDSDDNNTQSLMLIYTSPVYDRLLLKNQHQEISNDL